jgi:hypothetical protein
MEEAFLKQIADYYGLNGTGELDIIVHEEGLCNHVAIVRGHDVFRFPRATIGA